MASGTVTFSAALYAPGGIGPSRALVTVTKWAGALPYDGADDETFEVSTGNDLTLTLDETTSQFCYRIVVTTPATYAEETRFVTVPAPGPTVYGLLPDVDPFSFAPTPVTPTLLETIDERVADAVPDAVADYLIANPPTGAPDATAGVKGILQLAGDLGGTASSPTVPGLAGKADAAAVTTALAGKSNTGHTHAQGDVTGLAAALAALAPLVHTHAQGDVTGLTAALAALAPLASPSFTGNPLAPTPAPGDNDTSIATTGFVKAALDALIASAPGTLDTLDELAAALADDPNFATTITTALALKANLASPAFTGTPTAPTATAGTNTTQLATTAFVAALGALKANLASPTFTGDPKAPTPAPGDNDTSIATTAFVTAADALIAAAAVPKSLVDAKGDLLVGSANDTVVRLAVGSNGQIPYADSSQAAGIRWDAPPAGGGGGAASAGVIPIGGSGVLMWDYKRDFGAGMSFPSDGAFMCIPISIGAACNVSGMFLDVQTAGASGSLLRGGIYLPDGTNGAPGTRVVDGGTVSSASTGNKQWSFSSTPLAAGIYWLIIAAQGAPATHPTVKGANKDGKTPNLPAAADYLGISGMINGTGVTGAFPSTWSATVNLTGSADGPTIALLKA